MKDKQTQEKEKELLMSRAGEATELVIVGMTEDADELFNAEAAGVEPTFWDVYIKFNEVGDVWDMEEVSFNTEAEASDFADILNELVPDDVCLESM